MTYEQAATNRILINVPPEHAKSTVLTINYVTYRLSIDPNIRIIIVSKTQGMARKFLSAIKTRLSHPNWTKMQVSFGPNGGYKADSPTWSADMIYLGAGRDSGEKDPTVQALGFGSQIYGARADLIILDDVVMNANAHEWEKQIEWLQKEVITRLGRHGKLLIVGTRVAPIDLYKMIRDPDQWTGGKSPFTYMAMPSVLEFDEDPDKWVTLWPYSDMPFDGQEEADKNEEGLYPRWSGRNLYNERQAMDTSTWALVYQQQDISENSAFDPVCVRGSIDGMRKSGALVAGHPGHPRDLSGFSIICGLDPAMIGDTAAVCYAIDRNSNKRYIVDAIKISRLC